MKKRVNENQEEELKRIRRKNTITERIKRGVEIKEIVKVINKPETG